jgi:hypothetical protein
MIPTLVGITGPTDPQHAPHSLTVEVATIFCEPIFRTWMYALILRDFLSTLERRHYPMHVQHHALATET